MTKPEKSYVDLVCKQAAWLVRGSALIALVCMIPVIVQLPSRLIGLTWFWVPISFVLVVAAVLVGFTSRKFLIPQILAAATLVYFGGTYFTL